MYKKWEEKREKHNERKNVKKCFNSAREQCNILLYGEQDIFIYNETIYMMTAFQLFCANERESKATSQCILYSSRDVKL